MEAGFIFFEINIGFPASISFSVEKLNYGVSGWSEGKAFPA
ncbi:MAG: hypothetical protein UHO11_03710 [Treponema sp.]|nr:hypothetical protein [Treponema sp.]